MILLSSIFLAIVPFLFLPIIVAERKVVGLDFYKKKLPRETATTLARRQETVIADLSNELLLYLINVTVGTPPQSFSLQLDTGSSDTWFPAVSSNVCQQYPQACSYGAYNYTASSTCTNPNLQEFRIQYVDGSQIAGQYIQDTLNIGNTQLSQVTMAAAEQSSRGIGIMGIGFMQGESSASSGITYPNVISQLKSQGFINTLAYSLYLNDLDSNIGSILFGGVDTTKYHGDLVALPVQLNSRSGSFTSFSVAWTGLTITGGGKTYTDASPSQPIAALLDCGTTDMFLPDDLANAILNGVGVITLPKYGNLVPCSVGNDNLTLSFQFGGLNGATIRVAISEFVTPIYNENGTPGTFEDGTPACQFGLQAAAGRPILFGDVFLRSAYVVYDLENNVIALAQTKFDKVGTSNIQIIQSGSTLPGVNATASGVTVQQTATNPYIQPVSSTPVSTSGVNETSRSPTFLLTPTTTSSASSTKTGESSATASATKTGDAVPLRSRPYLDSTFLLVGAVLLMNIAFDCRLPISS